MPVVTNINDIKKIYRRRVPKMFFDYAESGSWTEQTFRANVSDFADLLLRQRVAVDMSGRHTRGQMLGEDVAMPVALAPVGKPFWFQLYVMKDQDYMSRLLARAKEAKCSALVITLDLQVLGQRHKDIKNGLSAPPKLTPKTLLNLLTKWRWSMEMLGTKRKNFGNVVGHAEGVSDTTSLSSWIAEQFDPKLDWNKIKALREQWDGKVILKGILDAEDAKLAVNVGADAIIVSNHGGRQLDGAQSSIRALSPIIDAVGDKIEVHVDGGIRSGQDVLKALALGAKGTYIGRSYIYGLGAMGQKGVRLSLEIIQKELETTMALCGHRSLDQLSRDTLMIPADFRGDWA